MSTGLFVVVIPVLTIALGCGTSATGAGGAGGAATTATTASDASTSTASASTTANGSSVSSGEGGASGTPLFVAVGYGGRRMSSLDGIHWANDIVVDPNGGDDDNLFRGVGFVSGGFIAVGGSAMGQNALTADGKTWVFLAPATSWLADVVELNNATSSHVIVTAGGNGIRQRSLDGGFTWRDAAPYYAGHFRGIATGNGVVIAAGHTYGGTGASTMSTDGATWSTILEEGTAFSSIAFGNGIFVATGAARCSTSTDGTAWNDCSGVSGTSLDAVVFANDQFIVGDSSGYFLSSDGLSWTHKTAEHHSVAAYGAGLYIGLDWPDKISTSPDLMTWTMRQQNTGPAFVQVEFGSVSP